MPSDVTASIRRASARVFFATVVALSEHGSWSGTVWSSVSSSQRILSLWLQRLSTDRIARQWRDASPSSPLPASGESPLVVFGKRGHLALLLAVDAEAERPGLPVRPPAGAARGPAPARPPLPAEARAAAGFLAAIVGGC